METFTTPSLKGVAMHLVKMFTAEDSPVAAEMEGCTGGFLCSYNMEHGPLVTTPFGDPDVGFVETFERVCKASVLMLLHKRDLNTDPSHEGTVRGYTHILACRGFPTAELNEVAAVMILRQQGDLSRTDAFARLAGRSCLDRLGRDYLHHIFANYQAAV